MMKEKLQKAWVFVKSYWAFFVLILGSIFAAIVFTKRENTFEEERDKIAKIHKQELEKIAQLRRDEQLKNEENERKLKETLDAVQKQYDEAKKDFDDKKKAQIAVLVKKHSGNPTELARQLSALTGFVIIQPSE